MKPINGDRGYILSLKKENKDLKIAIICFAVLFVLAVICLWQTDTLLLKVI